MLNVYLMGEFNVALRRFRITKKIRSWLYVSYTHKHKTLQVDILDLITPPSCWFY